MAAKKQNDAQERLYTISELAAELDLTTRAIRFYEEKGLICPRRSGGNQRIYSRRERARLRLILRGRRLGYSLEEIAHMIGPAQEPLDELGQIERSLVYGQRTLAEIARRQAELMEMKRDLLAIKRKLQTRLRQLRKQG